jgi:hypothetical protein
VDISKHIAIRNASLKIEMLLSLQLASHRSKCHILVVPASRTHLSLLLSVAMRDQRLTIPVRIDQHPPRGIVKREDRLMLADVVLSLVF